jgi:glucose-6-phosphate isomerase
MQTLPFFSYDSAIINQLELERSLNMLEPIAESLKTLQGDDTYISPQSFINLPFDKKMINGVCKLVEQTKSKHPALMVVVGIGGSNLGAQAVYQAIYGAKGSDFPLYFADTVDSDALYDLMAMVEGFLKQKRAVLITVISKSGGTTETIANFECFLALLKKYHPRSYQEYIIVITDHDSPLWRIALQERFAILAIPHLVGGRYSVFSPAGLFPLAFAGVDIMALCQGAEGVLDPFASIEREARVERSPFGLVASIDPSGTYPAISAAISAYHYKKGFNIHDTFVFSTALEGLGRWYRQLLGESIGKNGIGITPTVSVGSTDLHSVGQLYLGGPRDKLTTFVVVANNNHQLFIPQFVEYEPLIPHIQGKSVAAIMQAIFGGIEHAYQKKDRPFMTITLPEKSAFYIGKFLQYKMIEMVYLGALLQVNPFDQPAVELYKTKTKEILAHE